MTDSTRDHHTHSDTVIEVNSVWKIFGEPSAAVIDKIRQDTLSKAEALARYDAVVGVADASFSVQRGEIFCIMGLSGSGKSTLVRHLNRLLEPTAGSIKIEGIDVMGLSPIALRDFRNGKVSMVFQNFALLPHRSVLDNIALPLEIRKIPKNERIQRARELLEIVDLEPWGNKFAHELSGGMQQRVGLARALAADPDVLLMDEPFSALDPLIRHQLQGEFIQLSTRLHKTTVFITHDLDEAVRIGHRIAIMREGRIIQIGTAEEIVMNPADDYVAEFVAGISRLSVVKVGTAMQPWSEFVRVNGAPNDNAKIVEISSPLASLVKPLAMNDGQIIVQQQGQNVGVVTPRDVLKMVQEIG